MELEFKLEVMNDCIGLGLLEGDEVLVSTVEQPRSNGKDLAVFEVAGECFISPFTRFGNQIMLLGERIQVVREHQVKIIGKVIDGSFERKEKAAAFADATAELIHAL
ncbi:hypothetical protein [Lysinibacillus sp. F5]|uniref:hypothetical protein n=1 Tax=Lysinibacillus sp. F5 TaxID=1700846 RepID=UPI00073893A1|nr:hypothetical protein [Lysinibacillus sp. F5]KUF32853.1 hypothetical protein AK833_11935 [Lysinibacillus sp. F5]